MSKSKKNASDAKPSATLNRDQIQQKLEEALSDLKSSLGEKKFKRRIKKAGKLISNGLSKKGKSPRVKAKKETSAETPVTE